MTGHGTIVDIDATALRRSIRYDFEFGRNVYVRVDLTVRNYISPYDGAVQWAMVLDSDVLEINDFGAEADAIRAYEGLVRECEADYAERDETHGWHITDVPGIPVLEAPTSTPDSLPPSRLVRHLLTPPVVRTPRYEIAQTVEYRGSLAEFHGLATVSAIDDTPDGFRYTMLTAAGVELSNARESSIVDSCGAD